MTATAPSTGAGSTIRLVRTTIGMSQRELGGLVGVSGTSIGRLERSGPDPDPWLLWDVERTLGARLAEGAQR